MSVLAENITKRYGTQKALDAVSLDIKPGGIVGLLGPNGAGKSTLMKILTCFIPPTSGSARVCGFDVMEQTIEVRKKTGYLPENNPLYTDLYVAEFLQFIAGVRNIPGNRVARVSSMIELTGLGPEKHKKIGALSKGYRQRVGLAQALLHDPQVLILDEPTSGLDPNQLMEIRNLIREIGREKTVMMSTHIMQEVEAICNRVIIIHNGKIVADDTTQNLQALAAAKAQVMVEFDRDVDGSLLTRVDGVVDVTPFPGAEQPANERLKQSAGITGLKAKTWLVTSKPESDVRAALFQFAVDHDVKVLSMHRDELRLEEVFQEMTRN
jgi:ABC-2 type transport system ATP-binding protein